jgi:hypothetical protein
MLLCMSEWNLIQCSVNINRKKKSMVPNVKTLQMETHHDIKKLLSFIQLSVSYLNAMNVKPNFFQHTYSQAI